MAIKDLKGIHEITQVRPDSNVRDRFVRALDGWEWHVDKKLSNGRWTRGMIVEIIPESRMLAGINFVSANTDNDVELR